jgi:CheY-like chemotaxis protein
MTSSRPAALIVDDQPFVGMVASDILKESGFQTFHACDAETATQVLAEHPEIGVVVTDSGLSGDVTGLDLCRRVSIERPDVQLVVIDATPCAADVPEGARLLRKPYASGELKALVAAPMLLVDA